MIPRKEQFEYTKRALGFLVKQAQDECAQAGLSGMFSLGVICGLNEALGEIERLEDRLRETS